LKSESLNLLEPSGPVQACNGITLPFLTDQKTFFLKENDLEKGWCVIFVQIILACKNARKKPKKNPNEFCDDNQNLN